MGHLAEKYGIQEEQAMPQKGATDPLKKNTNKMSGRRYVVRAIALPLEQTFGRGEFAAGIGPHGGGEHRRVPIVSCAFVAVLSVEQLQDIKLAVGACPAIHDSQNPARERNEALVVIRRESGQGNGFPALAPSGHIE